MLIEPATLHSHPCTFSVWRPCCDQWHTRLHSRTGKVISERMFAFELGACILCAPPAHSPDTSSKDFSRSLGAQGKFLRHAGKEDRRTPRNELIVLSVRLTFPKFNSHSQLGICAQPGSTKATRCTYKIGTSCAWFHTHTHAHTPTRTDFGAAVHYCMVTLTSFLEPTCKVSILCKSHIDQLWISDRCSTSLLCL